VNSTVNEATAPVSSAPIFAGESAPAALVYVQDRDSEGVIRQSLADLSVTDAVFTNAGVNAAVSELASKPSPRLLIVDISRADDPLARVKELANVCEPSTGVIVVGESNDISLYRELKDVGVVEYFFKPLVRNLFTQACSSILIGDKDRGATRTGKLVLTLSVRGGVGATTIATRSAWHLAMERERRVLLVDLDVYLGDAALQLGAVPTNGLREALEHPDRVDDLFLERAIIRAAPRLDLMASLEPLGDVVPFQEDAVLSLLANLLHHYRYVFVDVPGALAAHMMELMHLPSICLLVSDSRLVSARDVARWRARIGPNTPDRTTLHILNKFGAHGGLTEEQFAKAAGQPADIIVPYGHEIETASTLGTDGVAKCGAMTRALAPVFRDIAGEAVEEKRSFMGRLFG
jgi:pilus assembly protein CpaE